MVEFADEKPHLTPLVIGMDARDYERIWTRMHRQTRRLGLSRRRIRAGPQGRSLTADYHHQRIACLD